MYDVLPSKKLQDDDIFYCYIKQTLNQSVIKAPIFFRKKMQQNFF